MDGFLKELLDQKVICSKDIIKIKDYISLKYKDCTSGEKANILAKAVHSVLDNNIPDVAQSDKLYIKKKILKDTLKSNDFTISMFDIFSNCLNVDNKSEDFVSKLVHWINQNVTNKVTEKEIKQYDIERVNEKQKDAAIYRTSYDEKIKFNNVTNWNFDFSFKSTSFFIALAVCIVVLSTTVLIKFIGGYNMLFDYKNTQSISSIKSVETLGKMPENFRFKIINKKVLRDYLLAKKSLLGEEPYFSTIISVAKSYNLNPLILFAIAGQEQGFVPKYSAASKMIANNPFNVYHSWKEYNTNIKDATKIVCTTLLHLCKDMPENTEPFTYINKKYAADQNWAHGVSLIYKKLEKNEYYKYNILIGSEH